MKSHAEQPPYLRSYPAEKARQGHIFPGAPWRILILVAGLAGLALLALFLHLAEPGQSPVSPLERGTPTIEL